MYKKYKVLIFPGGTEIGLEINKALRNCKDIILYSANSNVSNHAPYVFRNYFIVPDIKSKNWLKELNKIIVNKQIDYIYPAYDDIIIALAENQKNLKAKLIIPPLKTCLIARSKRKTYENFKGILPIPKIYENSKEVQEWPIFLKPDQGQGSQNTYQAYDIKELEFYLRKNSDLMILEFLPGKEYTIDCFSNRKREILFCSGRERVRIKNGISVNSKIVNNPLWQEYAQKISNQLEIYGAWFFQMREDRRGQLKLLEIAPRIGGTMATHRVKGINFPLLSIYEQAGIDVQIMLNDYKVEIDRALINRYKHNIQYKTIYVDFDDTLIIGNKVNTRLIFFLYQSLNKGKKIILLTKSKKNILSMLKRYSISEKIFSRIIHINKDDLKINHINLKSARSAIFIDDSFSERKAIANKYKIHTFDCSMLEILIDHKT